MIINGNQGSVEQIPLISNTLEEYLNLLSLQDELPSWAARDNKTHFALNAYGFDFKKTPHVYSLDMFQD